MEQHSWLSDHATGVSNKDLTDKFNQTFGTKLTLDQIKTYKQNHSISSGLNGQFTKGHVPANKGKKMPKEQYEKSNRTMFKKGTFRQTGCQLVPRKKKLMVMCG